MTPQAVVGLRPQACNERVQLGRRIALLAKGCGSTSALARAIGRSQTGVRKWIIGQAEPAATDLKRLCAVAGSRIEWLLYGHEPRQADAQSDGIEVWFDPSELTGPVNAPFTATLAALEIELRTAGVTPTAQSRAEFLIAIGKLFGGRD